jgi:hypothetical protein
LLDTCEFLATNAGASRKFRLREAGAAPIPD